MKIKNGTVVGVDKVDVAVAERPAGVGVPAHPDGRDRLVLVVERLVEVILGGVGAEVSDVQRRRDGKRRRRSLRRRHRQVKKTISGIKILHTQKRRQMLAVIRPPDFRHR